MSADPALRLARALADQRAVIRQAIVLGSLVTGGAMWRLAPLHEPEPVMGIAIVIGSLALGVTLMVAWLKHEAAIECADDAILAGYSGEGHESAIRRVISGRIANLESCQTRKRLAGDLRWRLQLAEGAVRVSPGYIRASALPPLSTPERDVLLRERSLVTEIANRLEQAPTEPQALVILWRIMTCPPRVDALGDQVAGEELQRRLHAARSLIDIPPRAN